MKKSILLTICFISIVCLRCASSDKVRANNCDENIGFKNVFMANISKVEEYVSGKGEREEFDNSLKFLSKYVKVSFEEMLNYSNEYTNIDVFNKDKNNWLNWYESNKCKNIQFKSENH